MTQIFKVKLAVVGESAVGKTSLVKHFVEGAYSKDYRSTIGANLFIKKMFFKNSRGEEYQITISLIDIAGQEKWQSMRLAYYSGCQAILIVGDQTRKNTFDQISNFWVDDVRKHTNAEIPIIIVANKNDLKSEIDEPTIKEIMQKSGIEKVIYTSAKTGYHVFESFSAIIKNAIGEEEDLIPIAS